ncbi:ATP-binding cassette domain-containing protein [Micromonospora sp. NPDC048842]|uniref:ATP-binding cassette domain-containing protein n=1 Tax=unclassified Micromonospora TaxID=2617518 RepID=UPI0033DFC644
MSNSHTPAQAEQPAIHVHGLEKSFKQLKVLRGVDIDVARGSIFALLGSNGAGKTTVVRILATLLRADDARLVEAADILASLPEQAYRSGEIDLGEVAQDDLPFDLLDALAVEADPRVKRLLGLMRERGWDGLARLERLAEPST